MEKFSNLSLLKRRLFSINDCFINMAFQVIWGEFIFAQNKRLTTNVGYQCNLHLTWPTLKAHKTKFIYG